MNTNTPALLPVHPGEILLEEFLLPMGISQSRLAIAIRVPLQRVHDLVHGRRAVTLDTAARLARFFGTSTEFWLNLQTRFELDKAHDEGLFARIADDVHPMGRA
ncbi:addiction module antidote protein, HigA family [Humidesulfovibrio mexicanus]|uniref:Addiction module antidote protein, HigA family n=1 Tax=Humidesulfovibrio mexicanus TaxID=147047 RepID=A0A239AZG0_9BACT|nr:HigA family addiction module antitoxin [Humidesulfovibrio mexicanus]SNS00930.1 addiction module antidote protein, HigA family [Humidesulfovibrio mexicanus]